MPARTPGRQPRPMLGKTGSARLAFAGAHGYKPPLEQDHHMPKLKTKSGAKKRFGRTGAGKIKHNYAYKRHRLISKPKQGKRKRRGTTTMEKGDSTLVLTYMPYLRG